MNKKHLYIVLSITFIFVLSATIIFIKNNKKDDGRLLSPSVLIVDLDGDGFETIPLNESSVYFDMDGDGLVERTEWIAPDDAMFTSFSLFDVKFPVYSAMAAQKHMMFDFLDRTKLKPFIDGGVRKKYFGIEPGKPLSTYYNGPKMKIRQSGKDGIFIDKYLVRNNAKEHCDVLRIVYETREKIVAYCKDGTSYPVKEIRLEYVDSNLPWDAFCKHIKFAAFESFFRKLFPGKSNEHNYSFFKKHSNKIMCLDQGFRPNIPDEYKTKEHRLEMKKYLKRLDAYKPGMFSDRVK